MAATPSDPLRSLSRLCAAASFAACGCWQPSSQPSLTLRLAEARSGEATPVTSHRASPVRYYWTRSSAQAGHAFSEILLARSLVLSIRLWINALTASTNAVVNGTVAFPRWITGTRFITSRLSFSSG